MNNLKHNTYGVLIITFAVVCIIGLLALGLVALNGYSDWRHDQEIWALEHPTPTPAPVAELPSTGSPTLDVIQAGTDLFTGPLFTLFTVFTGISLGITVMGFMARMMKR